MLLHFATIRFDSRAAASSGRPSQCGDRLSRYHLGSLHVAHQVAALAPRCRPVCAPMVCAESTLQPMGRAAACSGQTTAAASLFGWSGAGRAIHAPSDCGTLAAWISLSRRSASPAIRGVPCCDSDRLAGACTFALSLAPVIHMDRLLWVSIDEYDVLLFERGLHVSR